jgi:hypothetical protein
VTTPNGTSGQVYFVPLSASLPGYTQCSDYAAINYAVTGVATYDSPHLPTLQAFGACAINDVLFTFTGFTESHTGNPALILTAAAVKLSVFTAEDSPNPGDLRYGFVVYSLAYGGANAAENFGITYNVQSPNRALSQFRGSTTGSLSDMRTTTVAPADGGGGTATGLSPILGLSGPSSLVYSVTDSFTVQGAGSFIGNYTSMVVRAR